MLLVVVKLKLCASMLGSHEHFDHGALGVQSVLLLLSLVLIFNF